MVDGTRPTHTHTPEIGGSLELRAFRINHVLEELLSSVHLLLLLPPAVDHCTALIVDENIRLVLNLGLDQLLQQVLDGDDAYHLRSVISPVLSHAID